MLLDTASHGNFLGQDAKKGLTLVENLARSNNSYENEYEETKPEHDEDNKKEIKSLNEKLDKILAAAIKPHRPTVVADDGDHDDKLEEINQLGRCERYSSDDTRTILAQLLQNQSRNADELTAKMDDITTKMGTMYEELQTKVDKLEAQVKDAEKIAEHTDNHTQYNTDTSTIKPINVVTLRSGKKLNETRNEDIAGPSVGEAMQKEKKTRGCRSTHRRAKLRGTVRIERPNSA